MQRYPLPPRRNERSAEQAGRTSEPQILVAISMILAVLAIPRFHQNGAWGLDTKGCIMGVIAIICLIGGVYMHKTWGK